MAPGTSQASTTQSKRRRSPTTPTTRLPRTRRPGTVAPGRTATPSERRPATHGSITAVPWSTVVTSRSNANGWDRKMKVLVEASISAAERSSTRLRVTVAPGGRIRSKLGDTFAPLHPVQVGDVVQAVEQPGQVELQQVGQDPRLPNTSPQSRLGERSTMPSRFSGNTLGVDSRRSGS